MAETLKYGLKSVWENHVVIFVVDQLVGRLVMSESLQPHGL